MTNKMAKSTTIYKITRPNLTTYQGFRYEIGQTYRFSGNGDLCGPGWSHAYVSPQLAVLLNPIHANYSPFRLWKGKGMIGARDGQLKVGCSVITLQNEIIVPEIPMEARVTFALHCALTLPQSPVFVAWAEGWLVGSNRTKAAARAVARVAAWAAEAWAAAAAAEAWAAEAAEAWAAEAAETACGTFAVGGTIR